MVLIERSDSQVGPPVDVVGEPQRGNGVAVRQAMRRLAEEAGSAATTATTASEP